MTDLTEARIASACRGRFGAPLEVHAELPSTQSAALELAHAGAPEGAVVVADHQTAGRGRRGRGWRSAPGRALQFSLVLRPGLDGHGAGLLTTAVAVAVAEAVEATSGVAADIKWPNDVTVEARKLAGILVDAIVARGAVAVAVAGVGINVDWPCRALAELPGATSIACELERRGRALPIGRAELLGAVLGRVESRYDALVEGRAAEVVDAATRRSDTLGRTVAVRLAGGGVVEGRATRLLPSGALEVDVDGAPRPIDAGAIESARGS